MRMPFGKYRGMEVSRLPRPYLKWLRDNVSMRMPLEMEVRRALGEAVNDEPHLTIEEIVDRAFREAMARHGE